MSAAVEQEFRPLSRVGLTGPFEHAPFKRWINKQATIRTRMERLTFSRKVVKWWDFLVLKAFPNPDETEPKQARVTSVETAC